MSKEKWNRLQKFYNKMKLTEKMKAKKLLNDGADFYTITVDGIITDLQFYNENIIYKK